MNVIDIPIVNDVSAGLVGNVRASLGFLLTRLLMNEEGLLHADYRHGCEESVTWYVRRRKDGKEQEDEAVAVLPGGIFSSLAARIALLAEIDHQHGGAAPLTLS